MGLEISRKIERQFKKLGSGPIWLSVYRAERPPSWSPNFIRAIVQFARYNGLAFIPGKTVAKLKSDRYFKYIFSGLTVFRDPYCRGSLFTHDARSYRERLREILINPEKAACFDVAFGISMYMNNFPAFMPMGGARSAYSRIFEETKAPIPCYERIKQKFVAIDLVLNELELTDAALRLGKDYNENYSAMAQSDKLEYMKICIQVFEILMDQYGFTWKELNA